MTNSAIPELILQSTNPLSDQQPSNSIPSNSRPSLPADRHADPLTIYVICICHTKQIADAAWRLHDLLTIMSVTRGHILPISPHVCHVFPTFIDVPRSTTSHAFHTPHGCQRPPHVHRSPMPHACQRSPTSFARLPTSATSANVPLARDERSYPPRRLTR